MSDLAVDVSHLEKVYPSRREAAVRAVDDVSFAVERGKIFGLLGPNGAGKTTTLKILTTLLAATSGRAEVLGFDVARQPLEVRRRISLVIQETAVELFLNVRDNLLTFARFHGLRGAEARRRAGRVMEMFRLTAEADRKIKDLSGGFRRRVQVAKVFMVETPVVFLDEFSTGMDPLLKREVMGYLREESAKGRTILLTTQILHEAEELCDDILILNQGRQLARGNLHSLKLLTDNIYDVTLTFDRLPEGIEGALARHKPIRLQLVQNTVEVTLRGEEHNVLELVTGLATRGRLLRMEVAGATLEDIFVELVRNSNGSTGSPGN